MAEEKTEASKLNGADITVTLRKAIIANGEEVKELKFREPTAGDIDRAGNPVLLDMFSDPPKITFDAKAMTSMMAALAAVPPSTIKQMHTKDWNTAAWQLAGYFMPEL
jgi:hypothetical protein